MDEVSSALSESECSEVQEYIDADEYGLALRTEVAVYVEEKKAATITVRALFRRLAEAMELYPNPLLIRLQE